jgi:hypothetical protein
VPKPIVVDLGRPRVNVPAMQTVSLLLNNGISADSNM